MAYSETTWVNNTTPINDTNLNKIEQGIYDNSLVVDAITNTINPTDTETYKTAELTEGQITDVIGVSDIIIKGQTEQDGEPTPSSPVDANVVSGSNVINTGNENLFPLILDVDGTPILQQRCNVIIQKDEFIFTATGTDMYFGNVATANSAYQKLQGKLIKIPTNTQNIYLKVSNNAFSNNFICFFDENKVSLGYSNISTSKEVPNTAKYFTLRIGVSNSVSGITYKTKVMVSTMNKAYIPHQGKELPLDLPVENLFDSTLNTNTIGGVSINYNNDGSITLNGTATSNETKYVFSKYPSGTSMCKLKANTAYTASIQKTSGTGVFNGSSEHSSIQFWQPWDYSFQMFFDDILKSNNTPNQIIITKTPTQETDLKNIQLSIRSGDVFNNFTIRVQFEQGSKANAYTPFGTDPIELCKIGNYQDYFYKRGSKWYLHKEIQKKVLNGSEEWTLRSGSRFSVDIPSADGDFISTGLSNQYQFIANWDTHVATNYSFTVRNGTWGVNKCRISLINTDYEYVTQFKADLATNNLIVYYQKISQLGGATNTEITDTTLISQLEAIYNAPLYEETNITQENNDLPMVLDITACKDNINGIKAFIRK